MAKLQVRSLNGESKMLNDKALNDIRGRVRGQVVVPGDSNYDEVRQIWNAMIDRRPSIIVRCTGTADVLQTLQFARQHQLLTSVRGAGHNIAGKSLRAIRARGEPVSLVASTGIGHFGYHSRYPMLDLLGLVDPMIARGAGASPR